MKKELEAADTSEEMSANILNNKISIDARELIIENITDILKNGFEFCIIYGPDENKQTRIFDEQDSLIILKLLLL